jgi:hypothetical protein
MMPKTYAITYPQLLNQAIAQGLPETQLARLRQAYDVAERLSAGFYRGQGVPFICHLVRTASIVLAERQPVEAVMAAMLHATYLMRRFVEGLGGPLSERERERLRRQIGADVERMVWEYDRQPWYSARALEGHLAHLAEYSPITRQALVMHLANALEDYLDLGLVYRGTYPYQARIEAFGRQKIELARALGCDQLAQELEAVFRAHLEAALPASLKQNRINTYVLRNGPGAFQRSVSNAAKRVKHTLQARFKTPAACNGRMRHAAPLDYDAPQAFIELADWENDPALQEAVTRCLEIQRRAGGDALRLGFTPNPRAEHEVSEEALRALIAAGRRVSDITKDRSISNCIAFNFGSIQKSVMDRDVAAARRRVDRIVAQKVRALFRDGRRLTIKKSGHFWYPPGGFMGWHTNERSPGWRLYINYADEPGKSFFRYRDPASGAIVTKTDRRWNVRLFKISSVDPLWHAIYSQTNRFSLGYYITPQLSLAGRAKRALGKWNGAARVQHA